VCCTCCEGAKPFSGAAAEFIWRRESVADIIRRDCRTQQAAGSRRPHQQVLHLCQVARVIRLQAQTVSDVAPATGDDARLDWLIGVWARLAGEQWAGARTRRLPGQRSRRKRHLSASTYRHWSVLVNFCEILLCNCMSYYAITQSPNYIDMFKHITRHIIHRKPITKSVASCSFYRASAVAASPVLATIGMSVRLSVCPSHAGTE